VQAFHCEYVLGWLWRFAEREAVFQATAYRFLVLLMKMSIRKPVKNLGG
jgi:hypothetical protein